ncbi:MAG TPA: exo-alpha-sialidase [Bacteroidales bacterium]|jgi:sialidase-1|nr:exo-alpha-sialidase [Bacteroidales bacterium]
MKSTINKHRKTTFLFLSALLIGLIVASCALPKKESKSPDNLPVTVLQLTPSDDNPRNSEGDFITLDDGRILFIYSHYTGSSTSDHAPAYLAARYSDDGGRSWTDKDEVVVENEGEMNVMSVSLLRLQNGNIAFFYLRKNSTEDCIPMLRISKDEAKSWSDPVPCITDRQGYFVLNNARVIQTQDGRLLMPVALHQTPGGQWANKADLYCYFSDDNGQTWQSSSQVPDTTDIVTQEPGLIEMNDGGLMMYIRTNGGFQLLSYSSDGGQTWSHVEPSNIPSPLSPATIEKVPSTGDWLLVWNNNDGSNPEIKDKRTPLTMAISRDEGKTWEKIKNIHDDLDGWYCYIAIHFVSNDNALLGYCAGSQSRNTHLSITNITLLSKELIYGE